MLCASFPDKVAQTYCAIYCIMLPPWLPCLQHPPHQQAYGHCPEGQGGGTQLGGSVVLTAVSSCWLMRDCYIRLLLMRGDCVWVHP
jgi:hypothetical protein